MPNRGKDKPLTQEEIARNRGKGKSKGTGRVEKPVIISPEPDDGWVQLLETVSVDSEWFAHARQLPNGGVELKAPDGPENVGRAIFPVEPQQSYEIEMKLERLPGNRAMTLSLPIFGEHVLLVLDGMGQSGSRDRFSGVSSINRLDASFPGNPTHRKSSFFTPGVKKLEVQVLRDGMEVGIIARFNDLAFVNWRGNRAQLMAPPMRGQEKPMRTVARRMFGVISQNPVIIHEARLRALKPQGALVKMEQIPKSGGKGMAKGGRPGRSELPKPEIDMAPIEARIKAALAPIEAEIQTDVVAAFEATMTPILESYKKGLTSITESTERSEEEKVSARQELLRIAKKEPIPPENLPGLDQFMSRLRDLTSEHSKARDEALYPLLLREADALEALQAAYTTEENGVAAKFVGEKRAELLERVENLLKAMEGESEEPTSPSSELGNVILEMPERPDLSRRGQIVSWPRGTATAQDGGLGNVPSGLSTVAVSVSVGPDAAVALKSNGKLAVWPAEGDSLALSAILDADDLVLAKVAHKEGGFHLATIAETGQVQIFTQGWKDLGADQARRANLITDAVDIAVAPTSGVALRENGQVMGWGIGLRRAALEEWTDVAKIALSPVVLVGIQSDGKILREGLAADRFFPDVTHALDAAFGTHDNSGEKFGAVVLLPSRKVLTSGVFADHQAEVDEVCANETIVKLVGGYRAFAMLDAEDEWHFFGRLVDRDAASEAAQGCSVVGIGRTHMIGFRPS